jgi:hypothetical protein
MSQGKTYKFFGSEFKASTAFGAPINISGITNVSPAVITTAAPHGITTHGVVRIAGVGGMVELNGSLFVVEFITTTTLRLVGVDATNYGVYTTGGTIARATMTAHCEQTNYSFDSGSTPVTEDETNCGISTNTGAPRLGEVSLGFKSAENAFQESLEASRLATTEVAFLVQVKGQTKVRYDIGFITQLTETGSSGGTWDGTAAVRLTQQRIKVNA